MQPGIGQSPPSDSLKFGTDPNSGIALTKQVTIDNNLHQMLANAADGAFVIDEEQSIIYWNGAAQALLGYTADEVIGRTCYEFLQGYDDKGRMICCRHCYAATTALTGKALPNYDLVVRTKSGEKRWINISTLVTSTSNNQSKLLLIHLFRDASQKKQNEQLIHQILNATKNLQEIVTSATPSVSAKSPVADLTEREYEVLSLLAQGFSTHDIARSLSISSATVRNHVQNILNKLQVHSRLEAVTYALDHGITPKPGKS